MEGPGYLRWKYLRQRRCEFGVRLHQSTTATEACSGISKVSRKINCHERAIGPPSMHHNRTQGAAVPRSDPISRHQAVPDGEVPHTCIRPPLPNGAIEQFGQPRLWTSFQNVIMSLFIIPRSTFHAPSYSNPDPPAWLLSDDFPHVLSFCTLFSFFPFFGFVLTTLYLSALLAKIPFHSFFRLGFWQSVQFETSRTRTHTLF